jgi:hypothetical protein
MRHTDNPELRERLKDEADKLRGLLELLRQLG